MTVKINVNKVSEPNTEEPNNLETVYENGDDNE